MIELDVPNGCTIMVCSAYIKILFYRPLGRDGKIYEEELESLNQYPGIQAQWGRQTSPNDSEDLTNKYFVEVDEASPFNKHSVADAIAEKFSSLGLECKRINDGIYGSTVLSDSQLFVEFRSRGEVLSD